MENDDDEKTIVSWFDSICVSWGDQDALVYHCEEERGNPPLSVCYLEIQEYSIALASQMRWRFRPDYVLIDCKGYAAAEAVALLACMRISRPFVPVVANNDAQRFNAIVQQLRSTDDDQKGEADQPHICAVVCCENDTDPILGVFAQANVHRILFVDKLGNLREPLSVPTCRIGYKIKRPTERKQSDDNLYVLFTSGTTGRTPPKAVIGSHRSTLRRLEWFGNNFPPSRRVARRTPLTFVDSITELFGALLFPPTVLVGFDQDELASQGLGAILLNKQFRVTQVTMLPSQLSQLLLLLPSSPSTQQQHDISLERVIVSGEPCSVSLYQNFVNKLPGVALINLYGQTETTGDVLCAVLTDMSHPIQDGVVAVGQPILPEIRVQIDNKTRELVISGNLSNGYLNTRYHDDSNDDKTFVSFATGDVGFCRTDEAKGETTWYVRGRVDDVHKVNGVWTSPTEAETAIRRVFSSAIEVVAVLLETEGDNREKLDPQGFTLYAVVDQEVAFTRQAMRDAGVPWNLIPKQVFQVPSIPRGTSSGAGKVNRVAVKKFVMDQLRTAPTQGAFDETNAFMSLLASTLQLTMEQVDVSKSFVELGGDSASAVTFLYHLRTKGLLSSAVSSLSAADILSLSKIEELPQILNGETPVQENRRKKQRMNTVMHRFRPRDIVEYSNHHYAVEFAACVDAAPLVNQGLLYGACQGGVVQAIDTNVPAVVACQQLTFGDENWMVQAGMVVDEASQSLVVCACQREGDKGLVTAFSLDLKSIVWQRLLQDGPIKNTPVLLDQRLWIVSGKTIVVLDSRSGNALLVYPKMTLPFSVKAAPCVVPQSQGAPFLVYASAEWDVCGVVAVPSTDPKCQLTVIPGTEVIAPVFCDLQMASKAIVVSDSTGTVHFLDSDNVRNRTLSQQHQCCHYPLTSSAFSPLTQQVVVGSYDGFVRCLQKEALAWSVHVPSAVFAQPLWRNRGGGGGGGGAVVVATTTAGDIVEIDMDGTVTWSHRIHGEIWSTPTACHDGNTIAFGARDSRLHVLRVP